jgi:hypothetical protein
VRNNSNNIRKSHPLFNINSSTIPESGRYSEKPLEGTIMRSLNLAPSTFLGDHHNEEVEENMQKREYTKLGGGNIAVPMPNKLNNINYHRHNNMKDYTYSTLTGSYYY